MKSKKSRSIGTVIGLILLVSVGFLTWNNLREENKQPQQQIASTTAPMLVVKSNLQKTKGSNRKPEDLSLEVRQRLASAGFKTDSFIAVKTEKTNNTTTR